MPKPKKGDVLRWGKGGNARIYLILEEPKIPEGIYAGNNCAWQVQAVEVDIYGNRLSGATPQPAIFQNHDVEEAGWEYVEDPFVRYVKTILHDADAV